MSVTPAPAVPAADRPAEPAAPLPCPDCAAVLPVAPASTCPTCALPLTGPDAGRLYAVDLEISRLRGEREHLLSLLRAARSAPWTGAQGTGAQGTGTQWTGAQSTGTQWTGAPAPAPVVGLPVTGPAAPPVSRSPQRVLLGLGALLLLVATSVLLAVVWLLIGLVGQAVLVVGITAGAGAASVETARRGLASTATTLAWLAAGLTVVGAQAGAALGLPGLADADPAALVGGTAAVGALAAAVTARASGQRVFALLAVLSSALVAPALLVAVSSPFSGIAAALGVWGLAALAVRLPGSRPAGAASLLLGLLLAVGEARLDLTGDATAAAAVAALLAALLLVGASLRAPQALVVAGAVAGPVAVVALGRWAQDPAGTAVVALGCVAAVAAGAAAVRGPAWGTALAAGAASLAAVEALARGEQAPVAALSAAAALGCAVLVAGRREHAPVLALAVPAGAAAAGSALLLALGPAGADRTDVVVAAGSLAVTAVAAGAWRRGRPDEPGLGLVAAAGLVLGLLLAAPLAVTACAALLAAGGLAALGYACLPDRGRVAPVGVVLSSAASWTLLADREVALLEVYTLPVAALLLLVGLVRAVREPDAPSWTTVGPAAAMALVPSAQLAVAQGGARSLVVTAAAVAVVLLGVQVRARALVLTGGLVTAELALVQLGEAAQQLPRWLVLGALGLLLLSAGTTYERRAAQARAAGTWVRGLR